METKVEDVFEVAGFEKLHPLAAREAVQALESGTHLQMARSPKVRRTVPTMELFSRLDEIRRDPPASKRWVGLLLLMGVVGLAYLRVQGVVLWP